MKVQIKNERGEMLIDVMAITDSNEFSTQLKLGKNYDSALLFKARALGVIKSFFTTCAATYVVAKSNDVEIV
jgi:hypothetical protein